MDSTVVDWLPSLLVVGVALAFGILLVWFFTRSRQPGGEAPRLPGLPLEERDLLARRDALLTQLRELLDTAAKREPEQLARERYALEMAAAGVLRDLERQAREDQERPSAAAEPVAEVGSAPTGNPALRGFLWATGVMLLVGGLAYLVGQQAAPRQEGMSVTGNTPGMSPAGGPEAAGPVDPEVARAKAAVDRAPQDIDARMNLARVYLGRQDMMGVWNETQFVLARNPRHPRALSYQALVRLAMGQSDMALDMMKKALASAPDFLDGYIHLALIYVRTGKAKDAEAAIAEAARRFPDQRAMLERTLAEIKAQTPVETSPPTGEANPHAVVPAPGEVATADAPGSRLPTATKPAPEEPAAQVASGPTIAGSIALDPALQGQLAPGAVIYVMARPVGAPSGAPLAVIRLGIGSFPLSFEIGSAHSMTGGALPESVLLEARLDDDGDAATRTPNDPKASLDGVKLGTRGVKLVLKRGQKP